MYVNYTMYVLFGKNELNGLYFCNDITEEEKEKRKDKEMEMEREREEYKKEKKERGEKVETDEESDDDESDDDKYSFKSRDVRSHKLTLLGVFSSIKIANLWKDRCPLFDEFFLLDNVKMDQVHREPMRTIESNRLLRFKHNSYYAPRGGKYRGSTTKEIDIYTLVLPGDKMPYGGSFSSIEMAKKFSNAKRNYSGFLMAHKIDVGFVDYKKERSVFREESIKTSTDVINKNRHLCDAIIEKYKNESEVQELYILFNKIINRSRDGYYGFHNGSLHDLLCKCCKHFTKEDIFIFINFCNYVQNEAIGRTDPWEYLEFSRLIKFKK